MDLRVRADDSIAVDTTYGRFSVGANLRVQGTPAQPRLTGTAAIAPGGELYLGGHTYQVESGVLEFRKPTTLRPDIRFNARTSVSGYEITLDIQTRSGVTETTLQSDPPLPEDDIASLLLSGQRRGGGDAAEAVTEQLAAALSGEIVGAVGRAIGFDSVRVEQSNPGDILFDASLISVGHQPGAAPDVFQARLPRSRSGRQPEPPRKRRRHLDHQLAADLRRRAALRAARRRGQVVRGAARHRLRRRRQAPAQGAPAARDRPRRRGDHDRRDLGGHGAIAVEDRGRRSVRLLRLAGRPRSPVALAAGQRLLRGRGSSRAATRRPPADGRHRTVTGGPDLHRRDRPAHRARDHRHQGARQDPPPARHAPGSTCRSTGCCARSSRCTSGRGWPSRGTSGPRSTWRWPAARPRVERGRPPESRHHRDRARQQEHRARGRVHRQRGADRRRPRQGDDAAGVVHRVWMLAWRREGGGARGVPAERVSAGPGDRRRSAHRRRARGAADPDRGRAASSVPAPCASRAWARWTASIRSRRSRRTRCSPIAWWPTPCASSNVSSAAPATAARA